MYQYEEEHLRQLRTFLPECTVLLKSNGAFPLTSPRRIALYGNGARHTQNGGTGSGEVNSRFFVTVEQGLEAAGFTISTKAWLDAYDNVRSLAKEAFFKEIKRRAKEHHTMAVIEGMGAVMEEPDYQIPLDGEGEAAIYVLSRTSGEGNDRKPVKGDILLSETETRDILALRERFDTFMLVLNVGGPLDLTPVLAVENILLLSQLGAETGSVLADILLGKSYPSGKLTTTWSAWQDYSRIGSFGDLNDTRYREGIYVGYRYFDSVGKRAQFPFGFGLSFTEFSVGESAVGLNGTRVNVSATVRNNGSLPGKETLQLYVSVPEGKLDQPYQTLTAWKKTKELLPGESERLHLSFDITDVSAYDTENAMWILEQGQYILRLGTSSADTVVCGVITLSKTVPARKVRSAGGKQDFDDWKPEKPRKETVQGQAPMLSIDPAAIRMHTVCYQVQEKIDPLIASLSDEELIRLNIGAFDPKAGATGVIGNASTTVAGAAGETTSALKDRGIPALVMADGPAGLRLCKQYAKGKKGMIPIGETIPETIAVFLSPLIRRLMRLLQPRVPKNAAIYDQYATMIPIGTAVAQSWNPDGAEVCGDVVGAEMERFGIHLWLAPALNIHRDIRCGRNFEYYSEDPLVSGVFAAAMTAGVQKHPGCATTIKHFAANNQESNRYGSNSIVSERALREIYLRGFGICVKRAQPHALMTSYNLLNGIQTAERRDLIEDILRCEFGFQGIVMTDWLVGGMNNKKATHAQSVPWKISAAGNDLLMPGGIRDYKNLLNAVKTGHLDRRQLQINATRVYELIKTLTSTERTHDA